MYRPVPNITKSLHESGLTPPLSLSLSLSLYALIFMLTGLQEKELTIECNIEIADGSNPTDESIVLFLRKNRTD